jgi:hypothetical protein
MKASTDHGKEWRERVAFAAERAAHVAPRCRPPAFAQQTAGIRHSCFRAMPQVFFAILLPLTIALAAAQDVDYIRAVEQAQKQRPTTIGKSGRIAPVGEAGTPMLLHGRVVTDDGGPAADAIVFAYQTDRAGLYDTPGSPAHSWRLRGWARADKDGRFAFETIGQVHTRAGAFPRMCISPFSRARASGFMPARSASTTTRSSRLTIARRRNVTRNLLNSVLSARRETPSTWISRSKSTRGSDFDRAQRHRLCRCSDRARGIGRRAPVRRSAGARGGRRDEVVRLQHGSGTGRSHHTDSCGAALDLKWRNWRSGQWETVDASTPIAPRFTPGRCC